MKLIIFRHGLAMEREEAIEKKMADSLRPLVPRGKDRTKKMAKFLKNLEPEVDLIVSSPYVRAMETAEIIRGVFKTVEIVESVELVPSSPPMAFAQWMKARLRNETTLVIVGHEPQLSTLATWLLAGGQQTFFDLKKSGIICLELENFEDIGPKTAELSWMTSPKLVID